MKKTILTAGLLSCAVFTSFASYTGRVYVDKNNNGKYDKGENTLKNVLVSDGLNVVKTDAEGLFLLPGHEKEKFIFITTPSGYKTDNSYYRRINTGKITYDFGVQAYSGNIQKDGSHRFLHISDTEIHGTTALSEHTDWVQNMRDYADNEGAAFIIHTGDICYEGGLNDHIKLMNTANMNTQMFYTIGNHDLVKGAYGEELFEKNYGPVYYSFDAGNMHYIVTPMLGGDYRPAYTKEEVYRWLKNDLAQIPVNTPIMIFNHDLLTTKDNFIYALNDTEYIDLDAANLKAWLYGHWHINHIHKHAKAYSICTSTPVRGGIDHSASAFRVMHIDKNGDFTTELRYSYIDKSVEIASIDNMQAAVTANGDVFLSVNAYSTASGIKQIRYSCIVDEKKILSDKSLSQNTDFNWSALIPLSKLMAGKFVTVNVDVDFANGEKAQTKRSFIYSPQTNDVRLGNDWTNLLGDAAHQGIATDTLIAPLQLKWIQNAGSNVFMTTPLIYDNKVYIATVDEDRKGNAAVLAMAPQSGKINWRYPVRSSIKNTIAAGDGLILAQDIDGWLYAINATSGKLAWEKKLATKSITPTLIEGLVIADHVVYAGSGAGLCATDLRTGKELWRNKDWEQHEGSTATLSVGKDILIGSAHWGALYGNDIHTGEKRWQAEDNGIRHRSSSATIQGDMLYLTSDNSLFIMAAATGTIISRKGLPYNVNVSSSPLVTDREIIFGTAEEGIVALDRETLTEKWKFKTGPALIYTSPYVRNPASTVESSPVLSGNLIFFGGSDGVIYALNKEKGSLIWKHQVGAPVFGSVAISGNTLFVADFSGNVYAFTSPVLSQE